MPGFIPPELATLVSAPPSGADWLHEMKFDGYRVQVHLDGGEARAFTRGGHDWTHRFAALMKAAPKVFKARQAIVDGEAVVMDASGVSDFGALQEALGKGAKHPISFHAFDLLHIDGQDLRRLPLEQRKRLLRGILKPGDSFKFSDHIEGDGTPFYRQACRMKLEGIVSKRCGSRYISDRTKDWLKTKCTARQEFVIGGWRISTAMPLGALLVGYYDDTGRLIFAGKVGTGFSDKVGADLARRLRAIKRHASPFLKVPAEFRRSEWVEPRLVAEVEYTAWTRDGYLRHASFKGLREDKRPQDIRREKSAG